MQLSVAKQGVKASGIATREPSRAAMDLLCELRKEPRAFRNELACFMDYWLRGVAGLEDRENDKEICVYEACRALLESTRISFKVDRDLENSWENISHLANLAGGRLLPPVLAALRQSLKESNWLATECAKPGCELPGALKELLRRAQKDPAGPSQVSPDRRII